MSKKHLITVAHDDPRGLVALLVDRLGFAPSLAQRVVAEGAVFVDGRRASSDQREVTPGQKIQVFVEDTPQRTWAPQVVYEDRDLLIVDKPAGLPCQPGRRGGASLLTVIPGPLWLPHRLDAGRVQQVEFDTRFTQRLMAFEAYQVEQVIVDVGNPVIFVGTYHTYQVVVK